jgi:hypothetical protein
LLLVAVLTGCNYPITRILAGNAKENTLQSGPLEQIPELLPSSTPEPATPTQSAPEPTSPPTQEPTESPAATVPVAPTVTSTPAAVEIGPEVYPEGVNPLTGLPVSNSQTLGYSPALVSITNFPISARPQAGLSFSPFVFEMYIGEGMTRFLALFYGDYPQKSENSTIQLDDDRIGPVRSGRLPFESLRKLYNGFLVMASASPTVKSSLNSYTNVWGTDQGDINSAMIPATRLEEIASQNPDRIQQRMLSGLLFDPNTPLDGKTANKIWIPFSFLNQVIWRYDAQSGAYLRYQDNADGTTFTQATDRLNNEPLTYENVVVLFADHAAARETLIDITFMYIDRMPALLFRDGKMYEIYWTTANADYEKTTGRVRPIRFIDAQGNPFPLKPGQTWVEIVQPFTRYREVVDSDVYFDQMNKQSPGSGNWAIYFFPTTPERK